MSDTPCDRIALELAATIVEARDDANTFAAIADPRTPPEPSPADLRGVELLDRTTEAAHHAIAACAAITLDTLVEYTTDLALVRTLLVHIADSLVVIQAHHEALEELDELKARLRHPSRAGKDTEAETEKKATQENRAFADYYRAARDSQGGIRLNRGRGLLVATANHTRDDVQGWFDRAAPDSEFREQYRAALALLDSEADDVVDAEVAPCDRSTSPCDDDPDSPCAFPGCDLNDH